MINYVTFEIPINFKERVSVHTVSKTLCYALEFLKGYLNFPLITVRIWGSRCGWCVLQNLCSWGKWGMRGSCRVIWGQRRTILTPLYNVSQILAHSKTSVTAGYLPKLSPLSFYLAIELDIVTEKLSLQRRGSHTRAYVSVCYCCWGFFCLLFVASEKKRGSTQLQN